MAAGIGLGDVAGDDQTCQVHFECLHSFGLTSADDITHLASLALTQQVTYSVINHQGLISRDSAAMFGWNEALADDSLQRTSELNLNLVASVGGEDVNNAVKCLRCVIGVQCCENKVTSFGKRERDGDRFKIAHFAKQDHIGIFS